MPPVMGSLTQEHYDEISPFYNPTKTNAEKRAHYDKISVDYEKLYKGAVAYLGCAKLLLEHLPHTGARVLDIACGTGLLAKHISLHGREGDMTLIGLDYSAGMLTESAKTGLYADLVQRDITQPFNVPGGLVDVVTAAGVFFDNHVGPEAIKNVTAPLRPGGLFILSVREVTYDSLTDEYNRNFAESGITVLSKQKGNYWPEGGLKGYYFLFRKADE